MSHHLIPDSALDLWARGFTAVEIASIIRDRRGRRFTQQGIEQAIVWARKQGDMRAARRNDQRERA